jgi:glycosyltransferase involved in cell wall biosynthesis
LKHDVKVLYQERRNEDAKLGFRLFSVISNDIEDGIKVVRIKFRRIPGRNIRGMLISYGYEKVLKMMAADGWRPDIIHIHVHSAGVNVLRVSRKLDIPTVVTEHWSGFVRCKLSTRGTKKAITVFNGANFVIAVSSLLEESIKAYGINNKISVVPNPVDVEKFSLGFYQDTMEIKRLLFVGFPRPIKGLDELICALAKLLSKRKDFRLDIVGNSPHRTRYESLVTELGLGEIVQFHGNMCQEEVASFMKNCSFYIQPSHHETFGVTFIEAMSCGKPIVATKIPALVEKISSARGILVIPRDVEDLAKAIDYMLDHYHEYNPVEIRQYALDNFSYKAVSKKLNAIYQLVLAPCN